MDRESIKRKLKEQFEQSLDKALDAVEQAPDGRWIAASEWQVREIFQGMKWDRDRAEDLMNLIGLPESGQWKAYRAQHAAA